MFVESCLQTRIGGYPCEVFTFKRGVIRRVASGEIVCGSGQGKSVLRFYLINMFCMHLVISRGSEQGKTVLGF